MNAIDIRLNLQLLQQDIEAAGVLVRDFFETLKAYEGVKINPVNLSGLTELTAALQAQTAQIEKLNGQVQSLTTITQTYAQSTSNLSSLQQKAAAAASDQAKQEAILKVQIQEQTKANVDAARQLNPIYQQRVARLRQETDERRRLAEERRRERAAEAEEIKIRKQEIADAQLMTNEYALLKNQVKEAEIRYANFARTLGTTAAETRKAEAELGVLNKQLRALDTSMAQAGSTAGGALARGLTSGLSMLRTFAYILPGLGIAGIFNLLWEGIGKVIDAIQGLDGEAREMRLVFSDNTETTRLMVDVLNELGNTSREISDSILSKLNEEIRSLNDELGRTPTTLEQAEASMKLLRKETELYNKELETYEKLSVAVIRQNKLRKLIEEDLLRIAETQRDIEEKRNLERIKFTEQDMLAQGEANKAFLEHNIELRRDNAKGIADDAKASYTERLGALKTEYNAQLDLNKQFLQEELGLAFDSEGKKSIAREKFRYANLKAEQDFQNSLRRLSEEQSRKAREAAEKAMADLMKKVQDQYRFLTEFNQLVQEQNLTRLQTIAQDTNAIGGVRILALRLYLNQQRLAWEQAAEDEAALAGKGSAESLAIRQKYANMIVKLESDVWKQIADISRQEREKDLKAQEDAITRLEQIFWEMGDQASARLKANRETQKAYAKEVEDLWKRVRDAEKNLAREAFDFIGTLIQARADAEIERIERQMELTDEMYEREQTAIQKSTLSSKDKAAYEQQLSEQKLAADKKAAQQERKIKHDAAVIQKQVDAGQVVAQTAIAIVSALKLLPPFDLILAGLYGAIGAVQLAKIEATHIPAYEQGGTQKEDSFARIGERDKPELVKEPGRSPYWVMKETIKYLPKGTEIIPMFKMPTISIGGNKDDSWEQTKYIARAISTTAKKEIRNVVNNTVVIDIGFETYKHKIIHGG